MSSNNKLHIVFPIWKYIRNGGVKVLINLSDQLVRRGIKSEVVVVGEIPSHHFGFFSPHSQLPVPGFIYLLLRHFPRLATIWDIWAIFILFSFCIRTTATHVICNFHLQVFPVRVAQILFRKRFRIVYYIQAYEPDFFPKPSFYQAFRRWLARRSYRLKVYQFTNSFNYHMIDPHINNKPDRCITPGIDLNVFTFKGKQSNGHLKVGTLYSPIKVKGGNTALAALSILKLHRLPLELFIGTSYSSIPTDQFKVVPLDSEEDLVSFYQSMDILVAVPYKQFGAPHLPILEGMACGCALVCTDFFLTRHLKNAFVVPPENPQAIVEAITSLIDDPNLLSKIIEGGKSSVTSLHWDLTGKEFLDALLNI